MQSIKIYKNSFQAPIRAAISSRWHSSGQKGNHKEEEEAAAAAASIPKSFFYPNTDVGIKERSVKPDGQPEPPLQTPYPPFPDGKNPKTGEMGGPAGPEPTRFGDWERKGRVSDF